MKIISVPALALAALAVTSTHAAAVTFKVDYVSAFVDADGKTDTNFDLPFAEAEETQTYVASIPGLTVTDKITAKATQGIGGFSSVSLEVESNGNQGFASTGVVRTIDATAQAVREFTLTNDGATATGAGKFDFRISGIELEVFHAGGGPDPEITLDFLAAATNGDSYIANITLKGEYNNFYTTDADKFSGTVSRDDCIGDTCYRGKLSVSPLSGSLDLGFLAPGEGVTIYTSLRMRAKYGSLEVGASGRALDPNVSMFESSYVFDGGPGPSVVPLPAGAWLLLTGLTGLAALRRRPGA